MVETLTIRRSVEGKVTEHAIRYEGRPETRYERTHEYATHGGKTEVFGCHVFWCYYLHGKRVATIVVDRGNGAIAPAMANLLRRCWPDRVEVQYVAQRDETLGLEWQAEGLVWLRDQHGKREEPFEFDPEYSDKVFVHPDDDDDFDATADLSGRDRELIASLDQKAEVDDAARQIQAPQRAPPDPAPPAINGEAGCATVVDEAGIRAKEFFVFCREGQYWIVVFGQERLTPIPHMVGMQYLCQLLSRPMIEFSARDLYEMAHPPPPSLIRSPNEEAKWDHEALQQHSAGGSTQHLLDDLSVAKLLEAKAFLQDRLNDEDRSAKQRARTEEEIEVIEKHLSNRYVARKTGGAAFEDGQLKKVRQTVCVAVKRACNAIEKQSEPLGRHLRSTVLKGKSLQYCGKYHWVSTREE